MGDAPERIWAYYSTVFGAAWSSCTDDGATEYTRADIAAAREAELRAERNEALSRERALLDSNEVNRQAVLDANAAHQRQVDNLRAEVERLTRALDSAVDAVEQSAIKRGVAEAEVERLTQANREAVMQAISDGCQAQEALERAVAAEAERDKVRDLYRSTLLELQRADADNARPRRPRQDRRSA